MNKFEKIMKDLSDSSKEFTPEQIKTKSETIENQLLDLFDMEKTLSALEKSGKAELSDKDQLIEVSKQVKIYSEFLDSRKMENQTTVETESDFNLETGQLEDGIEVQFQSDFKLPIEIKKYSGSYYPRDKRTKEESDVLLHKHESLVHDNASRHPTMMYIHSLTQMEVGYYLGTMYLGYFNGKYETKIRYKKCSEIEFQSAKKHLVDNSLSFWQTGLDVEIYQITETRGKYHSYEAYLIDTIRGYPVRMTLQTMDKLPQGVYSMAVKMQRNDYNGSYKPVNEYYFNHQADSLSLDN